MTDDIYCNEVLELRQFLNAWLIGEVSKGNGCPDRLSRALAGGLCVIHPNVVRGTKGEAVCGFSAAYDGKPSTCALVIGNVETRMIDEDPCLATHEQWHRGEPGRARTATAVLRRRPATSGAAKLSLDWMATGRATLRGHFGEAAADVDRHVLATFFA